MSSINNLLPGSRRSVPYIVETGERNRCFVFKDADYVASDMLLEDTRAEQGIDPRSHKMHSY